MDLHAMSRVCHHPDGLVRFSKGSNDMIGYIVGISKPSNKEPKTEITEGLGLDAELLDRVFKVHVTTVKCIPYGCRLAFSQALKTVLCKVVAHPYSVNVWVRLLLFPRCTLQVYRPKNRQERRSENRKSLQQSSILKSLATWEKMMAKHPYKPPPSMLSITFSEPPFVTEIDSVFGCIKSFPKGTSCRRHGLRAQHILDALCGEASATSTDLLKFITSIVNLWLARRCSPILAEFVASAPLTPLLKTDNEIRPIAVGTIWRRLVSKVAMKGMGKEMSKYLSDFQFEVGVSGGAEAVLHNVNRLLSEYHNDRSLAMLTVDLSNAFNLLDRSALLCTHIWSATGVQQGDPLGPLFFALILHPLLHKIKDSCKLLLHAWYLDDGTVIRDSEGVAKVPSSGVKPLGGDVSRDAYFISGLGIRRAANAVDLMSLLPQLHDLQSELLLLRSCLCGSIENIVFCGGPFFGDLQWRLASLPIRFGGLGLYSACLDSFGEHVVHCKELPGFKYRHDMIRDVLFDICRCAGISAKKEVPVNFLTDPSDGRSTLRPADVLVFGWVGEKHACVDMTEVSPIVKLSSKGFTAGQAALKAASGGEVTQPSSTGYAHQCYDT
uniref:Reverse transcriptase domain-containing protein n=1 Tax=Tanacetum cinerariifolium TaxID=118510 RepID=A0A6L2KWZ5_TANCI|nr:hypothetical protein [Tanacetum cinerariifolium]